MHSNAFQIYFFFLQLKPIVKLYGAHIRSNDALLNSLGRGSLWATVKFSRYIGLPNRLPSPAHICDVPLPSVLLRVSVFLHHYLLLTFQQCVMIQKPRGGAHFPSHSEEGRCFYIQNL